MAHGKTVQLNMIGGPMAYSTKLVNGKRETHEALYSLFSEPGYAQANTFQGLQHCDTVNQYCKDVRSGESKPNPTGKGVKKYGGKRHAARPYRMKRNWREYCNQLIAGRA